MARYGFIRATSDIPTDSPLYYDFKRVDNASWLTRAYRLTQAHSDVPEYII